MAEYVVSSGVTSTGLTLSDGGITRLTVFSGGIANSITIQSGGHMIVSSGGAATTVTVAQDGGELQVSSGGWINNADVNAGRLEVKSGGTAYSPTVTSTGVIVVSSGGVATDIVWTPCEGKVIVETWGYATFTGEYAGVYYGENDHLVSTAETMDGQTINDSCTMYVMSDGMANDAKVSSGGSLFVCSNGSANKVAITLGGDLYVSSRGMVSSATISSGGKVHVYSDGVAEDVKIGSGGYLDVFSAGLASRVVVSKGGLLLVSSGGRAVDVVWTPCEGLVYVENMGEVSFDTYFSGVYYGSADKLLSSAATMDSKKVGSGGDMHVFLDGVANSTTVNDPSGRMFVHSGGVANQAKLNGEMHLFSSGVANSATVNSGGMIGVSSGGTANGVTVNSCGALFVESGGTAFSVVVNGGAEVSDSGTVHILSGGTAKGVTVNAGGALVLSGGVATNIVWTPCEGHIYLLDGGSATFADSYSGVYYGSADHLLSSGSAMDSMEVGSAAEMYVMADGTVNDITVADECLLYLYSGGIANNAILASNGLIYVSGGVANSAAVRDGGVLAVCSDGSASNAAISKGGRVDVSSGGILTGKMTFESGATVYVENGAFLDFDISGLEPSKSVLANDLTIVTGAPSYSLTVSGSQAAGTYSLAKGATDFTGAITVRSALGLTYGTVHVGETVYAGRNSYTLNLTKDELTVTVNPPTTTNKKGDVTLANTLPQARYMYGCGPTAVAMLLGYYDLYGYRGKELSDLIEGDVDLKSRGTGQVKYEMNDFDSALGRATATRDYVERFYSKDPIEQIISWNFTETTPEEELPYSFVDDGEGTELRTDDWNCIADYLGTGQFWRGNETLSTAYFSRMLEDDMYNEETETITDEATQIQRTINTKYESVIYGLYLYVQDKGYDLDRKVTGVYQTDVDGGDFTFDDYRMEIDAGRPVVVFISDHIMTGYGYNAETREILFDDCYNSGRMVWDGVYHYADADRKLEAIGTIGFLTMAADIDLAVTSAISSGSGVEEEEEQEEKKTYEKLIVATAEDKLASDDYCFPGSPLYLSFGVTNEGSTVSGGFEVRIYADGKPVDSLKLKSLDPGDDTKLRNISLPVELDVGLHTISVKIDPDNEIQELYALNNVQECSFMVLKEGTNVVQGTKTVASGNVSTDDYVMNGAKLQVQNGGTAEGTLIQGKVTDVSSSGKVTFVAGTADVAKGGLIRNATVYEYGQLRVSGTAEDILVHEDGTAEVYSGGVISGIVMDAGGVLKIQSGGVLTGQIDLEEYASVTFADGAVLKFDLTQTEPEGEPFLNDISFVGGTPRYTITVGNDQAEGTYVLADGAENFRDTITVTNTAGAALGTVEVGGLSIIGDRNYLLKVKKDTLTITIGAFDPDNEPDDGWNDYLFNKKMNPAWNKDIDMFPVNTITGNCELVVDEIGTVLKDGKHNMFGNNGTNVDTGDFARLNVSNAARLTFTIDSTAAGTFYVYEDGFDKSGNRAQIQIAKVAVKAGKPAVLKDVGLTSYGSYYVAMTAKSVKKAGTVGLYNVSVTNTVLFVDADGADNNVAADGKVISVGRSTGAIVMDKTSMTSDTSFSNFVGFGDSIDYVKLNLASSAYMSFSLTGEGDGTAKFTIWKYNAETDKLSKVGGVTTLTAKKAYTATTKAQFLEVNDNSEYYLSMECSDAAKGKSVYYNVEVASNTIFFDSADDGRNNALYDKQAKAIYGEDEDHHFVTTTVSAGTKAVKLDYNSIGQTGYSNFVGYGDAVDYAKIKLMTSGSLSFTLTATGDATFVVYKKTQDKKGKDKLETLQTTKLKLAKGENTVEMTTNAIAGLEAGEYYISMTAKNTKANDKGNVFYNVTAKLDHSAADALAMPETDTPGMTDNLSFGQTAASDMIAEGAAFGLLDDAARLNDNSAWRNLALA